MYPHERSLVKQLAGKPFAIIGVNSDSDLDALKVTIKEENISWRSFQNDEGIDGKISDVWGIQGWPTIFILDEEGVIRWKGHGGKIDEQITSLLADMGHEVKIVHEEESEDEEEKANDDDGKAGAESSEEDDDSEKGKSGDEEKSDKGGGQGN